MSGKTVALLLREEWVFTVSGKTVALLLREERVFPVSGKTVALLLAQSNPTNSYHIGYVYARKQCWIYLYD